MGVGGVVRTWLTLSGAKNVTIRSGEESRSRKLPVSSPPGGCSIVAKVTALSGVRLHYLLSCSSEPPFT